MRIEYNHYGEGAATYPLLRCRCGAIYHLSQSVRWDELDRLGQRDQARSRGWHVPDEGPVYCLDCVKRGAHQP